MNLSSYEGPRNGDYVAYVDQLMRASPEYRRTLRSIDGAIQTAVVTPGSQAASPMSQLRSTLQKARDMAEQAQQVQGARTTAAGQAAQRTAAARRPNTAVTKQEAQQRFKAMEREIEGQKAQNGRKPWVSPGSLALIVGGMILSQFIQGFGVLLAIMGLMSLVGGVLKRLQGR
ncbi:hypothetical protein [Comamonas testosteroni]|uniref:Uncharacterized protein n=1 Tax=Comamonas testosteroni TaxID=285 RepID=A0A8B4S0Q0_COMTE|nr:hypothetical protein [Comamonas testosteroni]EHN65222.1 hypothetical protein CTATCC11996_12310 [Comamonas testosteroni ATCC 11996]QQN69933.1 hypothetical protein IYN88_00445 [Comamonas testosteroni]SUY76129.1 Uncharacterised protein [Comamonas testosteroni]